MNRALLLGALALTSGCSFYFGGDDSGDDCYYEGDGLAEPAPEYRNPETGGCESFGYGGGYCDTYANADREAADPAPTPDWALCWGYCESYGLEDCLAASGCRAAMAGDQFLGCWGTAPSGPIQGGLCEGLDAYGCSQHDDCIANYQNDAAGGWWFQSCAPEGWSVACNTDVDCPAGYQCDPVTGACAPVLNGCEGVDCSEGYHCELECYPCEGGEAPPDGGVCSYECYAACVQDVPDEPWVCEGVECPVGEHCEAVCTSDGACWSDCVPDDGPVACEALTDEASCAAREDCRPAYTGYGCTCGPDGTCTCAEWVFDHCDPV